MSKFTENAGVKFHTESELELWRAETLLTKEPETIAWLEYNAELGGVFYDIGANIGAYSLYAASINSELAVYSFEPVENNYCSLLKNKDLNEANNINPFQIAISNKNNVFPIYIKDCRVGNSGAQLGQPIDETGATFKPLYVQHVLSLSLDAMINSFGFPPPHFIKIDVDGKEKEIVEGMLSLLEMSCLRSVLIEFNSRDEQEELQKIFELHSFRSDPAFNELSEHSKYRRAEKNSTAVNMVFTKPL